MLTAQCGRAIRSLVNTSKRISRALAKSRVADDEDALIQTRVPASVAERIKGFAKEEGISTAAYVRRLLRQHADAQP